MPLSPRAPRLAHAQRHLCSARIAGPEPGSPAVRL